MKIDRNELELHDGGSAETEAELRHSGSSICSSQFLTSFSSSSSSNLLSISSAWLVMAAMTFAVEFIWNETPFRVPNKDVRLPLATDPLDDIVLAFVLGECEQSGFVCVCRSKGSAFISQLTGVKINNF